jgi:hypothetical protein
MLIQEMNAARLRRIIVGFGELWGRTAEEQLVDADVSVEDSLTRGAALR